MSDRSLICELHMIAMSSLFSAMKELKAGFAENGVDIAHEVYMYYPILNLMLLYIQTNIQCVRRKRCIITVIQ